MTRIVVSQVNLVGEMSQDGHPGVLISRVSGLNAAGRPTQDNSVWWTLRSRVELQDWAMYRSGDAAWARLLHYDLPDTSPDTVCRFGAQFAAAVAAYATRREAELVSVLLGGIYRHDNGARVYAGAAFKQQE